MPIQVTQSGELVTDASVKKQRSHAMQEMISKRPGFLSRWALLLFILFLGLILAGAWFIQYPDVIEAKATLTGTNAPKEIIVRQEGKITRLFVKNNDRVEKNKIIAWIESNADHRQVGELSERLDSALALLQADKTNQVVDVLKTGFTKLGELQTSYQEFVTGMQHFNDYLANGFYFKKKAMLQQDIEDVRRMRTSLQEQKKLLEKDLQLTEEGHKANESLYKDKIISRQEYRDITSKLVDKQMTIPKIEASLLNNETQEREKLKELVELEHDISQQKIIFQQSVQTLQSKVNDWKLRYLIMAPINGSVSFTVPVQENRFVKAGMLLGFINPGAGELYAEVTIPQNNFGKIDTTQQVQLRFDSYPYKEFGYVKGRIRYISGVATDSGVLAYVDLPDNLVTNKGVKINYKNGLTAGAVIITNDTRLLQRVFNSISKLISR